MDRNNKRVIIISTIILAIIIVLALILDKPSASQNNSLTSTDNYSQSPTINNNDNQNESKDNNNLINNQNTNMDNNINEKQNYSLVTLHTNYGDITFELSKDKPKTTDNFIKLANSGFYNGVKFHRVINGFMIQTGDPLSKDDSQKSLWGTGGPGYKFTDELTGKETYNIGTVAMANSGPDTNGSQFFIMTSNTPLPPSYTVFGKVITGQDIANQISSVETDSSDRPIKDVIINSVDLK